MRYTVKELKELAELIAKRFKYTPQDAARIVGESNKLGLIEDYKNKDFTQVPKIADRLNIEQDIRIEEKEIPTDITDNIQLVIQDYMDKFHIEDMKKATASQWQGACICVGKYLQKTGILLDKSSPVKKYSPESIAPFVEIWRVLCTAYDKAPLAVDFIAFIGVSPEWFYGGNHGQGQKVTTGGSWIRKKVLQIQEGGLGALLVDGKRNPTGTIFFLKNVHGWRDVREVAHIDGDGAQAAASYPTFDLLEDKGGEV